MGGSASLTGLRRHVGPDREKRSVVTFDAVDERTALDAVRTMGQEASREPGHRGLQVDLKELARHDERVALLRYPGT